MNSLISQSLNIFLIVSEHKTFKAELQHNFSYVYRKLALD